MLSEKIAFPSWLTKRYDDSLAHRQLKALLSSSGILTVCVEARCPNIYECFSKLKPAFMVLGNKCTRICAFCSVNKGNIKSFSENEDSKIADLVEKLGLKYVILTSPTRDDLNDSGLDFYMNMANRIKYSDMNIVVEILTPDFRNAPSPWEAIAESKTDVFGHNMETVKRLYGQIRPDSSYERSLELLEKVKHLSQGKLITKSAFMVGLGETDQDVIELLKDLRHVNCDIVTIGQYLKPDKSCVAVKEFVTPEKFANYKTIAMKMGISCVSAGPFVRSSYRAEEMYNLVHGR